MTIKTVQRLYVGQRDLEAIAELWSICEAFDRLNENMSVSELQQAIKNPSLDTKRGLSLWEDVKGGLIAFAWLSIPPSSKDMIDASVGFIVHPQARGDNLELQIIAWSEKLLNQISWERGAKAKLHCSLHEEQSTYLTVLNDCGFTSDRYFFSMERDLNVSIPQPQIPSGFTVRQVNGSSDAQQWVELYNESFFDHWNYHEYTIETYYHWLSDSNYKPELDLVAVTSQGQLAAFCRCWINSEHNCNNEQKEGLIDILGTRSGFRRMGLGRTLLLIGMQKLKEHTMDIAKLNVDANNSNFAGLLYESVGFVRVYTRIRLVKELF
jgi:mycothiol synthase